MKTLDFIGIEPKLAYKNKNKHQTTIGGYLSLLSILSIVSLSLYFTILVFQRKEITLLLNTQLNDNLPYKNLTNDKIMFLFSSGNNPINIDKSIFDIKILYKELSRGGLNNEAFIVNDYFLDFKQCDESYFNNIIPFYNAYKGFYCLYLDKNHYNSNSSNGNNDIRYPEIALNESYGSKLVNKMSYISIIVSQCKNNTNTNIICKPQSYINNILKNSLLVLSLESTIIQHKNKDTALEKTNDILYINFSNTITKRTLIRNKPIEYETDKGFVLTNYLVENSSILESPTDSYSLAVDDNILSIDISNSLYIDKYNRSYVKLQYLLANIGGIVKTLTLIAYMLNYFTNKKLFTIDLINDFINFNDDASKNNKIDSILFKNRKIANSLLVNSKNDLIDVYNKSNIELLSNNQYSNIDKSNNVVNNINNMNDNELNPNHNHNRKNHTSTVIKENKINIYNNNTTIKYLSNRDNDNNVKSKNSKKNNINLKNNTILEETINDNKIHKTLRLKTKKENNNKILEEINNDISHIDNNYNTNNPNTNNTNNNLNINYSNVGNSFNRKHIQNHLINRNPNKHNSNININNDIKNNNNNDIKNNNIITNQLLKSIKVLNNKNDIIEKTTYKLSIYNLLCFKYCINKNNNIKGKIYLCLEKYFDNLISIETHIRNSLYIDDYVINLEKNNTVNLHNNSNNNNLANDYFYSNNNNNSPNMITKNFYQNITEKKDNNLIISRSYKVNKNIEEICC